MFYFIYIYIHIIQYTYIIISHTYILPLFFSLYLFSHLRLPLGDYVSSAWNIFYRISFNKLANPLNSWKVLFGSYIVFGWLFSLNPLKILFYHFLTSTFTGESSFYSFEDIFFLSPSSFKIFSFTLLFCSQTVCQSMSLLKKCVYLA